MALQRLLARMILKRSIIMCRMTLQLKPVLILSMSKFLLMMRRKSFQ